MAWNHSVGGNHFSDNEDELIIHSALCGPLLRDFTHSGKQDRSNQAYSKLHSAINTTPSGSNAEAYASAARGAWTDTSSKESIENGDSSLALQKIVEFAKFQRGVSHDHNDSGYDSDLNEQ